ncbi:MAG: hypothetical protein CR982_08325 [Candidatus Cloacimonadota bacterium]|nr:MAG: hypothetical protein CR982_08325 [Candidatus Cloacimonadota bacterium]PIE79058.1 MAG: hypothetical protein CSA15_04770 [Candidatus Delongbacteria bacterium]
MIKKGCSFCKAVKFEEIFMDIEILEFSEARVLGTIMEKSKTTPENYPLTINSIVVGSNQKSNREPVSQLTQDNVVEALDSLKKKNLVWEVTISGSSRQPKYEEKISKYYQLNEKQFAILSILILRGAQTLGELKTRSTRYCSFEDLEDVEKTVLSLENHLEMELVSKLPLKPGNREFRYSQNLYEKRGEKEETIVERVENEDLYNRIEILESELENLKSQFNEFRKQFE